MDMVDDWIASLDFQKHGPADLYLVVDEICFPVHLKVLAQRSKHFRDLLLWSQTGNSMQSHIAVEITLPGFVHLLRYMYSGIFALESANLEAEAVINIWTLCHWLRIDSGDLQVFIDAQLENMIPSPQYLSAIRNELLENNSPVDVYLVVEGKHFPAHRSVIASKSDYLQALLLGGFAESKKTHVELKDATLSGFEPLLEFFYTGKFPFSQMNADNCIDVFELCDMWCIKVKKFAFCNRLKHIVQLDNLVMTLTFAGTITCYKFLTKRCLEFADQNVLSLLDHPSFLQLSPGVLINLINRNTFNAPEVKIFDSVLKWLEVIKDTRPDYIRVLEHVRFYLMSPQEYGNCCHRLRRQGWEKTNPIFNVISTIRSRTSQDNRFRLRKDPPVPVPRSKAKAKASGRTMTARGMVNKRFN